MKRGRHQLVIRFYPIPCVRIFLICSACNSVMPLTILPVSRHKNRSKRSRFYCILTLIIPIFPNFLTKYPYPILRITACFTTHSAKTLVLFSYPPCLILRKFTFEGAAVNVQQICRDLIPPTIVWYFQSISIFLIPIFRHGFYIMMMFA